MKTVLQVGKQAVQEDELYDLLAQYQYLPRLARELIIDQAIAALLHDAVEDQGGAKTREVIRQKFGDRVVEIVDGCTDSETIPKPPWRQRKEAYLEKIRTASAAVRRVSLADKLHNSRSTLKDAYLEGHEIWKKFNASKEETLWFYGSLLKIYREKDSGFLIDELERILNELEKV